MDGFCRLWSKAEIVKVMVLEQIVLPVLVLLLVEVKGF